MLKLCHPVASQQKALINSQQGKDKRLPLAFIMFLNGHYIQSFIDIKKKKE